MATFSDTLPPAGSQSTATPDLLAHLDEVEGNMIRVRSRLAVVESLAQLLEQQQSCSASTLGDAMTAACEDLHREIDRLAARLDELPRSSR